MCTLTARVKSSSAATVSPLFRTHSSPIIPVKECGQKYVDTPANVTVINTGY